MNIFFIDILCCVVLTWLQFSYSTFKGFPPLSYLKESCLGRGGLGKGCYSGLEEVGGEWYYRKRDGISNRTIMIEYQLPRRIMKYSKVCHNTLPCNWNNYPFSNSRITANHDKVQGFRLIMIQCSARFLANIWPY